MPQIWNSNVVWAGYDGNDYEIFLATPSGNQPPVADAGEDKTVTDSDGNGSEIITLDGSGSYDSDGTIVSYTWKEGDTIIETGVNLTFNLGIGSHVITLVVEDNEGATAEDDVVITVETIEEP